MTIMLDTIPPLSEHQMAIQEDAHNRILTLHEGFGYTHDTALRAQKLFEALADIARQGTWATISTEPDLTTRPDDVLNNPGDKAGPLLKVTVSCQEQPGKISPLRTFVIPHHPEVPLPVTEFFSGDEATMQTAQELFASGNLVLRTIGERVLNIEPYVLYGQNMAGSF